MSKIEETREWVKLIRTKAEQAVKEHSELVHEYHRLKIRLERTEEYIKALKEYAHKLEVE